MEGRDIDPYAVKTYLGWVLMGANKKQRGNFSSNLTQTFAVERFLEIESYGTVSKTNDIP